MEKQVINKVKTYFQHRPDVEGIWVSEDGHLFAKESAAKYYARFDNGRMRQKPLRVEYVRRVDVMKETEKTGVTEQVTETKTDITGTVLAEGTKQETETETTETAEDKTKTAETNEAKTEETKATETVETEKQSKRKNRQKKSGTEQKTK